MKVKRTETIIQQTAPVFPLKMSVTKQDELDLVAEEDFNRSLRKIFDKKDPLSDFVNEQKTEA